MTRDQFQNLARQGYNRIPVVREVLADLDTPLSTYLKLASGPRVIDAIAFKLGHWAEREEVLRSGLWNVNHVNEAYDSTFPYLMEQCANRMSCKD